MWLKWKAKSKGFRTNCQALGECLKLVFTEAFCQHMSNVSLLFRDFFFWKNCKQANIYWSCCIGPKYYLRIRTMDIEKWTMLFETNLLVKNHAEWLSGGSLIHWEGIWARLANISTSPNIWQIYPALPVGSFVYVNPWTWKAKNCQKSQINRRTTLQFFALVVSIQGKNYQYVLRV